MRTVVWQQPLHRARRPSPIAVASYVGVNTFDIVFSVAVLGLGAAWLLPAAVSPLTASIGISGFVGVRVIATALSTGLLWQAGEQWTARGARLMAAGVAVKAFIVAVALVF